MGGQSPIERHYCSLNLEQLKRKNIKGIALITSILMEIISISMTVDGNAHY